MTVAGFTSTGSKRPAVLFGEPDVNLPSTMVSGQGCTVVGADGRSYLDFISALGAVALGYGHPAVNKAAIEAIEQGVVGPLAPAMEEMVAADIQGLMPGLEQVRFLKSGAEAAAAAVRLARVITGRDLVLGCGYHGWLDWCSDADGVPAATRSLYQALPFNDPDAASTFIRARGDALACVIIEPVIDAPPAVEWLQAVRRGCDEVGAVLIFDEIKTAFRVALGGAASRWRVRPDLTVLGKALANGFPLAAVGGARDLMQRVDQTWISSTLATEWVSLAAARATLSVMREQDVPAHLRTIGARLLSGLRALADKYPTLVHSAAGIEEMCHLQFHDAAVSGRFARECAMQGLLFKRTGYNFVTLAHGPGEIDRALGILDQALASC